MSRIAMAAMSAAALVLSACGSSPPDAATPGSNEVASFALVSGDFTGNSIWIHGTRSVASDGKYPCLNEFEVCVPLDGSGKTAPVQDLCPSMNTPQGSWTFEYFLATEATCAAPMPNLYCAIASGETLKPGPNSKHVNCQTHNAGTDFDVCIYDPATGARGNCCPRVPDFYAVPGLFNITNAMLAGGTNSATVAPGSVVSLSFDYGLTVIPECPACIIELQVGYSHLDPQECPFLGFAPASGSAFATFTAPSAPGIYYLDVSYELQLTCPNAWLSVDRQHIASICVN